MRSWLSPRGAIALTIVLALLGGQLDRSTLSLLTMTLMWVALAHAWNIFGGYSGYLDLGQAAFVGVGAYAAGLVITRAEVLPHFTQALLLAILTGTGFAFVVGLLVLRLRGALFTLATLGLLALTHEMAQSTNQYFTPPFPSPLEIYRLVLILFAAAFVVSIWVFHSQFGLMLRAIREDEIGARARGINTLAIKLLAFTLVGGFASGIGAVRTYWQGIVTPEIAFPQDAISLILVIVLVGGVAHPWGPIVGGIIFFIVQHIIPNPEVEMLLAGVALLVVVFFLPNGLLGLQTRLRQPATQSEPPISLSSERIAELLGQPNTKEARVVLEGRSVTHDFGGLRVVNQASFWVRRGEVVGLLGPNGAGKSTLLNCVAGILKPSSGEVFLNEQEITRLSAWQINRYGLARTFERTRLFEGLTVHENMLLARKWRGMPLWLWLAGTPAATHRRADELLTLLGIGHAHLQRAGDLSTVEQRLLDIGMALMSEPSIILLDEITAGIPIATAEEIKMTIRQLNRDFGLTFFIIEHNISFAVDLCHRVYVLDHGSVVAEGTPQEIRYEPAVTDAYFGHE